ncbi:MAG TPA: hypothetical protein VEL11_04370 [Candidatus Bathyarchaeia archaeon]|nr:hypothetical protein [Candidatus Bathyarchaeia archaeon]
MLQLHLLNLQHPHTVIQQQEFEILRLKDHGHEIYMHQVAEYITCKAIIQQQLSSISDSCTAASSDGCRLTLPTWKSVKAI